MTEENLVLNNQGLIVTTIKMLGISNVSDIYEDLMQDGNIALINAYRAYDEDRGVKFSTFASVAIKNELTKTLRLSYGSAIPFRLPLEIIKMSNMREKGASYEEISESLSNKTRKYTSESIKRALIAYNTSYESKDELNNMDDLSIDDVYSDILTYEFIDNMFSKGIITERQHKIIRMHTEGYDNAYICEEIGMRITHISTEIKRIADKIKPLYGV